MTDLLFARDGFPALAARLGELGTKKVMLICGPSRRFVDLAATALAKYAPVIFDGARVHVPVDTVARAGSELAATEADTIVAIGGGSAIGLGKALRRGARVNFAAVPTTYAGSEMTATYGVTQGGTKQTGRDPNVRPDVVLYDPTLTVDMPIALTTQSMFNALAHVLSVASNGIDHDVIEALRDGLRATEDLILNPRALVFREQAARAASACASVFDLGQPGVQHRIAHLLGGALDLDHAALHAVLLPSFVAYLRATQTRTLESIEEAIDCRDLDAYLHDLLTRAGAPTALTELDAKPEAVRATIVDTDLPAQIVIDALRGLRPPGRGGRIALAGAEALVAGPPPDQARRVVVALHGRNAEAGTIMRRLREISGHDPSVCVIGLRTKGGSDRWYATKYGEPGAGSDPEVGNAIDRVDTALTALARIVPRGSIVLAGFSQGACLALEYAARRGSGLAGIVAPCGARIGQPREWRAAAAGALTDLPILVGTALNDKWIARADLAATIEWFRGAGARIEIIDGQGDRHEITARQRLRARELVLGTPHPRGRWGYGNTFESAARAGTIPQRQNTPRIAPHGLYPEQINGSGFTADRTENQRTWVYRVRPSSQRRAFALLPHNRLVGSFGVPEINLCGFAPLPQPKAEHDFVDGLVTLCGAGDARMRRGYAIHRYAANRSMERRAFYNADGDLLVIPEQGALTLLTELGPLEVAPGSIALIPRGVTFAALLHDGFARGYVGESFGRHFRLPERGVVGANGLADPRHFRAPAAWHEDRLVPDFRVVAKLGGRLHDASQDHSPFDVVGWHGNYAPYVYDLADFSPVGNVRFDHGDPSMHTVLSAPLDEQGAHTLDFVVFPSRMDATTNTFRPPYFHRNAVAEINGVIREPKGGAFQPGSMYITPPYTAHGVSGKTVEHVRAMTDAQASAPIELGVGISFQFETTLAPSLAPWSEALDDWSATWGSHRSYFS